MLTVQGGDIYIYSAEFCGNHQPTMSSLQPQLGPNDILVDGFLASMFTPHDAHNFFAVLLKVPNFLQHYHIWYSQGAWCMMPNVPYFQPPFPNTPRLLDLSVGRTQGTVVPQSRWAPTDEVDVRRHVEDATLQLPVFFVNHHGGIGFWLPEILQGRDQDLVDGNTEAPLGGKT